MGLIQWIRSMTNQEAWEVQNSNNNFLDAKAAAAGSGSPKATYATLAALQAAYPSGATGIYVVVADGKWYYWSGGWIAGGVYLSSGTNNSTPAGYNSSVSAFYPTVTPAPTSLVNGMMLYLRFTADVIFGGNAMLKVASALATVALKPEVGDGTGKTLPAGNYYVIYDGSVWRIQNTFVKIGGDVGGDISVKGKVLATLEALASGLQLKQAKLESTTDILVRNITAAAVKSGGSDVVTQNDYARVAPYVGDAIYVDVFGAFEVGVNPAPTTTIPKGMAIKANFTTPISWDSGATNARLEIVSGGTGVHNIIADTSGAVTLPAGIYELQYNGTAWVLQDVFSNMGGEVGGAMTAPVLFERTSPTTKERVVTQPALAIVESSALAANVKADQVVAQAASGAFDGKDGRNGIDGVDGHGLSILGMFATLEELEAIHPIGERGDAYAIGTPAVNELVVWNAITMGWQNIGNVLGSWTMNDLCIDAGDWTSGTGGWMMDSLCMDAGDWDKGGGGISTLADHEVDANAHSNILIDGNIN